MVYEINPFDIPLRQEKDAYLFRDYVTTNNFVDSGIIESRGYRTKNIQTYNEQEFLNLHWRLLGSHNAKNWQIIYNPSETLQTGNSAYTIISEPWNFIKAQVKSASTDKPAKVNVYITMHR